jgi:predicted nuclease with TOPRIM domain
MSDDDIEQEVEEHVAAAIAVLQDENNMLFDRAARRLAEIYELRARIIDLEKRVAHPATLDALDRTLDRLAGIFDDDANTMPDQMLEDYLTVRTWADEQPSGWDAPPTEVNHE